MALILIVRVIPNAGRNRWKIDQSGLLKCYLKSVPQDGKANQELLTILSKTLKLRLNDIEIIAGATSRNKRIKIATNLNYTQFLEQLGVYEQKKIFE